METQWLRTFVTAARAESFRAAAGKLFVNQTTVSHHIAKLEQHLGTALFEPSGRGVRLTQAGKQYLAHADEILAVESKARDAVQAAFPVVRLAASPSLAETLLPWVWRQLYRYDEHLQIDVAVYPSHRIGDAFQETPCDGAFSRLAAGGTLKSRLLFHDPLRLMAPADMDGWDVQSLMGARLVIQPDAWYSRELVQQLRARGYRPQLIEVEQIAIIKRLVEEHVGAAFLPESTTVREVLEGRLAVQPWPPIPPVWDSVYWISAGEGPKNETVGRLERILANRWPAPGGARTH